MKIEDLQALWEGKDLYFTRKGHTKQTTFEHAVELYESDEYYTEGQDIVVFDLDKRTSKEMLKFVFEKEPLEQESSSLWIWVTVGLVVLLGIGLTFYFSFGSSSEKQVSPVKEVIDITIPTEKKSIVEKKEEVKKIPIIDQNYENKKEGKEEIIATTENVITQDNKLLLIDKLNYEIETQRFFNDKLLDENNRLKADYKIVESENIELKNRSVILENQNKSLLSQKEELEKAILGEKTNLEKYLGAKLFEACRKEEGNLSCESLFKQFYNK